MTLCIWGLNLQPQVAANVSKDGEADIYIKMCNRSVVGLHPCVNSV